VSDIFPPLFFENHLYFRLYFQPIFWTPQSIHNVQMAVNSVSPYKIVPKKHIAVIIIMINVTTSTARN
jgi:hypothetical protein